MRIIEAISDTNIGGAGILLLTRLSTDSKMNGDTTVVLPRGSALKGRFEAIGTKTEEVAGCADSSFELFTIIKYMRIIRCLKPDIINAHGCLSFRIAAFLCGVPVRIYTRHCTFPIKKIYRVPILKKFVGGCQGILSNGVIAVAEIVKKDLIEMGLSDNMIQVIINGTSGIRRLSEEERKKIRKRLSIPENAVVVGIFARLEEYKGHKDLIEAAECLLNTSDSFRFLVVGKGSYEKELLEYCRKKGVLHRIIFTGFAEDITEYLNVTDINVNCSHGTETSSLALSEGMSIGIPMVASDFGGNRYMVENRINGLLYPPYDSCELAKAIKKIASDDSLRRGLSENARKRYERELNAKEMTKATYDYYMRLWSAMRGDGLKNP